METNNRNQQINFTEYEKKLLIQLIENNVNTIESKRTDIKSLTKKGESWKSIVEQYNCDPNVNKRDKNTL